MRQKCIGDGKEVSEEFSVWEERWSLKISVWCWEIPEHVGRQKFEHESVGCLEVSWKEKKGK